MSLCSSLEMSSHNYSNSMELTFDPTQFSTPRKLPRMLPRQLSSSSMRQVTSSTGPSDPCVRLLDFTLGYERDDAETTLKAPQHSRTKCNTPVRRAVASKVAAMLEISSCPPSPASQASSSSGYTSASYSDRDSTQGSNSGVSCHRTVSSVHSDSYCTHASPDVSLLPQHPLGPRPECIGAECPAPSRRDQCLYTCVDSDTSSFMQRPLCLTPVTGQQVSSSRRRHLAKKMKQFGRQVREAGQPQLRTLAVL